jgi:hypothetical protein
MTLGKFFKFRERKSIDLSALIDGGSRTAANINVSPLIALEE